ncbi:ATP-binding protein [Halobacillus salinarum]|uniref:ATP-binding protein n=1 Tax=Halobacillus salinarum TaxID=2932257 RepID=A0ABY4EKM7_9BACI|nr:ATP-binding protein [Halobacillus salinarum]UOQ45025.1 ATP-binding protein [Halobacillus salinarum]
MWLTDSAGKPAMEGKSATLGGDAFIGRKNELRVFEDLLRKSRHNKHLLHIYGEAGIGKTSLLQAFQKITEPMDKMVYFNLDSDDLIHSPSCLAEQMIHLISTKLHIRPPHAAKSLGLDDCVHIIKNAAKIYQIVIAIDHFEKFGSLGQQLREGFIEQLPSNTLVVIAGRHPLADGWVDSSTLHASITQLQLTGFNYDESCTYLQEAGVEGQKAFKNIWHYTDGHPLALSFFRISHYEDAYTRAYPPTLEERLSYLIKTWLEGISDPDWRLLIETASVVRHFNQSLISNVLKERVSATAIAELTSLPFVKKTNHGWTIHELVRSKIILLLKEGAPQNYHLLRRQSAYHFLHKMSANELTDRNLAEFLYHVGEEITRSSLFTSTADSNKYLDPIGKHNLEELEEYVQKKQPFMENILELSNTEEDFSPSGFLNPGWNNERRPSFQFVKNEHGQNLGLSIVVPINRETIQHLKSAPASRGYFKDLSMMDEKEYSVSQDSQSGWYIRMLSSSRHEDAETGYFLLYHLFPLLLTGGRMLISTPNSAFQDLIKFFGYKEVEGASFQEEDGISSPTYLLDVRGPRLVPYLNQLADRAYSKNHVPNR